MSGGSPDNTPPQEEPTERAYVKHARDLYSAFEQLAAAKDNKEFGPDTVETRVSEVYRTLGIPDSYYPKIKGLLEQYRCVEWVRRGNAAQDSVLRLLRPLPPAGELSADHLTSAESAAMLRADSEARKRIEQRVSRLENWVDKSLGGLNIAEALINIEIRLSQLEQLATENGSDNDGKSKT